MKHLLVLTSLLLMTVGAHAAGGRKNMPVGTFLIPDLMEAKCLPRPKNGEKLAEKYKVHWVRWFSRMETGPILGAVLAETERMNGKPFSPFKGFALDVDEKFRIQGLQSMDEDLGRQKVTIREGENVALLAHEMGHLIGNAPSDVGNGTWYESYFSAVPRPCHFTMYSQSGYKKKGKRNEEFAEVFAAYMTDPLRLKEQGGACRKAFRFFRRVVFTKARPTCLRKDVADVE